MTISINLHLDIQAKYLWKIDIIEWPELSLIKTMSLYSVSHEEGSLHKLSASVPISVHTGQCKTLDYIRHFPNKTSSQWSKL